jgi:site-specific DNA recombinase
MVPFQSVIITEVPLMRAAIYARYSSDLQRDTSLEDQIAVAKRHATERKWTVLKDHIYTDAGISGASIQNRPSVQRLLADAARQPKAFDVLLVDDSSRIARDIPDAIRVMQQLKFLGIRVIYISQGIDSESEQADALVAVHGLIDSLYLKELAKKTKRGLAGQLERGFSTGARQYGYCTVPVPDPSGKTDVDGRPILLAKRIEIDQAEAAVVRRIFQWAADGLGLTSIVERLNREAIPGNTGKRWTKTPVARILNNERYLGRQIWGQQSVEHEPGTGRRIKRDNPRTEWRIEERPELQIVSDELWERTQRTRAAVREAVAPKRNLARGKDASFHSAHLFTGFAKCHVCGGAMTSVSGGMGSPRLGCSRSWNQGRDACPNRLTIRMKVAEPQILGRLQSELLAPAALKYLTEKVEKEVRRALTARPNEQATIERQLQDEKRKLQNLVAAIEGGSSAPAALMKAVAEREANIKRLERELKRAEPKPADTKLPELPSWVEQQLQSLTELLKSDPARVKAEFRRLNLELKFHPTEAQPRPHYVVKGQCDLAALVFLFLRSRRKSAVLDRTRGKPAPARSSWPAPSTITVRRSTCRSSMSTARLFRTPCWNRSSSDM